MTSFQLFKVLDVFMPIAGLPDWVVGNRWPAECPGYKQAINELWPVAKKDPKLISTEHQHLCRRTNMI
jgi:hypothetical protein